ncbi:hypothetical protein [Burkholderia ubonensis]|uniref:hypothetical protein n=1 Tax=Burkholderia ubonensis TaxID=101571 RepID=UPI0012FA9466|nr:hypothetical protein [Burkholderia ubonensis]
MNSEAKKRLRCRPGDLAKVKASTNSALVGAVVLIERLRADGRWDVVLDRPAFGLTAQGRRPVVTWEFTFKDESLEPLAQENALFNRLLADLRLGASQER